MPELPDVELYLSALRPRIVGQTLQSVRLGSPFLLRSVDPPLDTVSGRKVHGLRRLGKRIVWEMDDELFLVFHLMIAGRFRWRDTAAAIPKKLGLAAFDFAEGTVLIRYACARATEGSVSATRTATNAPGRRQRFLMRARACLLV